MPGPSNAGGSPSDSDRIRAITTELVDIASVSADLAANTHILHYVREFFQGTSWVLTELSKHVGAHPALYISPRPATWHTKVLLLVHLDVVPAMEYAVKGDFEGKIFGRGVSDMKGPAAALLHLMRGLDPSAHDLAMLVVTDEEIGGLDGAKFCFADADGPHISCDICHCPDGGDGFAVVTHEKGVLRAKLTASGHNAHSAYPWLGRNAIDLLMGDIALLKAANAESGEPIFDNSDLPWHTTMNVSYITGGEAINQVPKTASAQIDIRFTEDWTLDALKALVEITVAHCQVEFFFEQGMLLCPPELTYVKDARAAISRHAGIDDVRYSRGHGTSDGHWADFPTVMFKPYGGGLHQDGEWLDFPSLIVYHNIIAELIAKWATISTP